MMMMMMIRLLLFYSVIFQSCKFQSPIIYTCFLTDRVFTAVYSRAETNWQSGGRCGRRCADVYADSLFRRRSLGRSVGGWAALCNACTPVTLRQ